jgi:ParB-like chromosome segregation protein Spo0J
MRVTAVCEGWNTVRHGVRWVSGGEDGVNRRVSPVLSGVREDASTAAERGDERGDVGSSQRGVVSVPIILLKSGESPRLEGQDEAHVARLAEIDAPLPPILVDRMTMRVIDGMHRLMAARRAGRESIEVEFFDGTEADAYVRGVAANIAHGFPLTQADRRAAVARIIDLHPGMSDRAIAEVAGVGARTVARVRGRTGTGAQPSTRIGKDGKARPLSGVEGRVRAAEVIAAHPEKSLRDVARTAGISPATARDVRLRLKRGEAAVPESVPASVGHTAEPGPAAALDTLLRDPSLRQTENGRQLLRLLRQNAGSVRELSALVPMVPPHCVALVSQLASQLAKRWLQLSDELDDRPAADS